MKYMENDYILIKELFEEKIKGVENKIESTHKIQTEISKNILEQTKRTNGRVNNLEVEVDKLKNKDIHHIINCPRIPEINEMDKRIQVIEDVVLELKFFRKYPKLAIGILTASVILLLATLYITYGVILT